MRRLAPFVRCAIGMALTSLAVALLGVPNAADAQLPTVRERLRVVDSTRVQVLTTRDGSRLVGRITAMDDSTLIFQAGTNSLTLPIADVVSIQEVPADEYRRKGVWFPHPHQTHLMLGPTGRTLPRGSGYVSIQELLFPTVNYGLTDRFSIGGGMTIVPGIPLDRQIFYVLPKVGLIRSPRLNVAAGALVSRATDLFDDDGSADPFGIAYGVGTVGGPDAHLTVGLGFPFYGDDLSSRPLVQLGGELRFAARGALVSENWIFSDAEDAAWISWTGIRFLAPTVSFDAAIAFVPGEAGWLPWIGVTAGF